MPVSLAARHVGRVAGLWRYPVKSMAGEALAEADVSWNGLAGDRRWAFIREGATRSGFPWLTIRDHPRMGHYRPSLSPTIVRTPAGTDFDVADPALAAELCAGGARVIRQDRGIFDTFPLSLITMRSIARLGECVGAELDVRRFRPNILVEACGEAAFVEDDWVGCVLRIGGLRMRIDQRDSRCVVITIDPVTTKRDPAILRRVMRDRHGFMGVYGTSVEPGRIALGDPVLVEGSP